jgi:hypothetical protein
LVGSCWMIGDSPLGGMEEPWPKDVNLSRLLAPVFKANFQEGLIPAPSRN